MTTNDEPLSTYRPAYVAGLERRVEELERENRDLNEQIALKIWHDVGQALPEHAYLVQEALKAEERLKEARAEVAEQREAMERALAVIEKVEWIGSNPYCPWCYGTEFQYRNEPGHEPDCPREAALAELRRVAGLQMR